MSGWASAGSRFAIPASTTLPCLLQPGDGGIDEVGLRAQPVQEQAEQAAGDGRRVGHGVPAPELERRHDQPAPQRRAREVTVDLAVEREAVVGHRIEAREERRRRRVPGTEGILGQVVEPLVVLGQAEAAGGDRLGLEVGTEQIVEDLPEDSVGVAGHLDLRDWSPDQGALGLTNRQRSAIGHSSCFGF